MNYKDIKVGQKLLLRGFLHGAYDAEVMQINPRRDVDDEALYALAMIAALNDIQIKVVLYPGEEPSLLWVNPSRLMDSAEQCLTKL